MATSQTHCCRKLTASMIVAFAIAANTSQIIAADVWQRDWPIELRLEDGRTVRGTVDGRTSIEQLWLNSESAGVELASGYHWDAVAEVFQGNRQLDADQLRREAPRAQIPALPDPIATVKELPITTPVDGSQDYSRIPPATPPLAANIQSLHIDARLANWDADAPVDGLLVTVYPSNALGEPVAVRGNLDLWLLGEVWPRSDYPHQYPRAGFQELARASHLVREVDFSRGSATFQLPLRHVHPEAMPQIATYGIVHARFGVNGRGVFEANDPFVRLREASPTRDRLQLFDGRRFFPIEQPPRLP